MGLSLNTGSTGLSFGNTGGATEWVEVDLTDGTWTDSDPAGLVASVTYSSGLHTFTEATLAASADLIYSSPNYTSWRAYKALVDANGDPLTAAGVSSIDFITQIATPSGTVASANVAIGIAVLPASTTYASIQATGIGIYQTAGTISGYSHDGAGGNYLVGAGIVGMYGTVSLGGGTQTLEGGAPYNSSGTRVSNPASRNYNSTIGAATPLFFWVEYSKRFNTDAGVAGAKMIARFAYRPATTQTLPLA